MANQPNTFYIRLHSDFKPNRSIYTNTVSNFENVLYSSRELEEYDVGVADVHITGTLDKNGLKTPQDWSIRITETFPSFDEIDFYQIEKWLLPKSQPDAVYRYKNVTDNWAFVTRPNYITRITTPFSERHVPVILRTDMAIRTDLTNTNFLNEIEQLKQREIEIAETDEEIQEILEKELYQVAKGETQTSYIIRGAVNISLNEDFDKLMEKRINEWKRQKIEERRLELLEELLESYPSRQTEWEMNSITLNEFLKHILATLNGHPLYAFSSWIRSPSPVRGKTDIVLTTNMKGDKVGQLTFTFDDKVKQIIQTSSSSIDPIKGLLNVNPTKEVTFEYPSVFPAFLETSMITHSLLGPEARNVIKTVQVKKDKNDKVAVSKYFSNIEYHPCERRAAISAINMSMVDAYGSPVQFKTGEMTVTLHCKKRNDYD